MSLFNVLAEKPPVQVLTPKVRSKQIADHVLQRSLEATARYIDEMNILMATVWNNQEPNITAASIVEGMGDKAKDLFVGHAAVSACLIGQTPSLASVITAPPDWANIEFEVVDGVPTGNVIITQK